MKKTNFEQGNIKVVIKKAGISQRDIAKELSISENQMSRIMNSGTTYIYYLQTIADLCQVTFDNLLDGNYEPITRMQTESSTTPVPNEILLRIMEKLDEGEGQIRMSALG